VWLADHPKTRETRVFKFAADGVRLQALKREVTLARVLREALGDRTDFVRILEWNFETAPFYLESEYVGPNLGEWAQLQGGIGQIPLQLRLRLVIDVARAIADAHAFGVLHKDIKPANLLIATGANGEPKVKVADFGSGALLDVTRLGAFGITNAGFTQSGESGSSLLTGTVLYVAPEVLSGQSPSIASDVYALGVLLYQFIVGEFRKPLSPGWEAEIEDRFCARTSPKRRPAIRPGGLAVPHNLRSGWRRWSSAVPGATNWKARNCGRRLRNANWLRRAPAGRGLSWLLLRSRSGSA
jgi:non-specific serine/threonine protein kinase